MRIWTINGRIVGAETWAEAIVRAYATPEGFTPTAAHEIDATWDDEANRWFHRCVRCGAESWGNAPDLPCAALAESTGAGL